MPTYLDLLPQQYDTLKTYRYISNNCCYNLHILLTVQTEAAEPSMIHNEEKNDLSSLAVPLFVLLVIIKSQDGPTLHPSPRGELWRNEATKIEWKLSQLLCNATIFDMIGFGKDSCCRRTKGNRQYTIFRSRTSVRGGSYICGMEVILSSQGCTSCVTMLHLCWSLFPLNHSKIEDCDIDDGLS